MEGWQRWVGGGRGKWSERSLRVGMHAGFFVFATFDETALVLEPVGDTGGGCGQDGVQGKGGMEGWIKTDL